jgi:hypothetical protein
MRKRIIVGATVAGIGWMAYSTARRLRDSWGIVPGEAERALAGDDIVEVAQATDTRGITIEAAPEDVWPWLVQMGYGRGGWYSIDQLDMRGPSADRIIDELQDIAVYDILPTHPGGGFQVRELDPGRSLVLYADPTTMQPLDAPAAEREGEAVPAGLAASGAFLSATPSQFRATWTFVLEPAGPGRTRLIERMRYWSSGGGPLSRVVLPVLGFGVFVMMQRQMEGIRTRAERLASERITSEIANEAEPAGAAAG